MSSKLPTTPGPALVENGVRVPGDLTDIVDVLFDGRRVWSVNPSRFPASPDGTRTLPWPRVLRDRLNGRAWVSVRTHLEQRLVLQHDAVFGKSTNPLRLVDTDGHDLTVTKWGSLAPAFDDSDRGDQLALVDAVADLLSSINGKLGHAFVTYGTLLGAVRAGALMGHDHDADIAYLSSATNPSELARESFALQRFLHRTGWHVVRRPNGYLSVSLDLPSGASAHVDVFTAHFACGTFYLDRWVAGALNRDRLLPLSEVLLEGRRLPAPRDPEALLGCIYGPGWAIPDPSFQYQVPREIVRHFGRWVGPGSRERRVWERYHGVTAGLGPDARDDQFAAWALARLDGGTAVLDLGCGRGLDACRYAEQGHPAVGLDFSSAGTAAGVERAARGDLPARFETCSLHDVRRLLVTGARFVLEHPGSRAVTARLLVDALPAESRRHMYWLCRTVLGGGPLLMETRAANDVPVGHRQDAPWQQLVSADTLESEIATHGGTVVERELATVDGGDGQPARMLRIRVSWPNTL